MGNLNWTYYVTTNREEYIPKSFGVISSLKLRILKGFYREFYFLIGEGLKTFI